jgi:hypothetical protein
LKISTEYGKFKRYLLESPKSYLVLSETCLSYDYNMAIGTSPFLRIRDSYKARKDFTEMSMSNGICKSSLDIVGNRIVHYQSGRKKLLIEYEFYKTHLITTFTADEKVVAKKYYKATK